MKTQRIKVKRPIRVKTLKNKKKDIKSKRSKKDKPNTKTNLLEIKDSANTFNQFEHKYELEFADRLKKGANNVEKHLIKLFKTPFTPSKYTPRNDYYTYINYQWMTQKSEELKKEQKYYVQVDSFRITQEKVYYELIDIVKDYIKNNDTPRSRAVKNVYESLYNLDNKSAQQYVDWAVIRIDEVIKENSIYNLFGQLNQNEIISWGCPIVWSVLPDEKNSKVYITTISPPQLTAYDYMIYYQNPYEDTATKKYKALYKKNYLIYVNEIFDSCLKSGHGLLATDVWDAEVDIFNALGCDLIKSDNNNGYNVVQTSESVSKYSFDFAEFLKKIGYKNIPKKFICTSLNYINCIMTFLATNDTWKTAKWRTYYLYTMFRQLIRFHSEWRMIHFRFHEKFVAGQPVPWPKEIYPVFGLSLCFNTLLSNEYALRNKRQQHIDYVKNMAEDLLTVYKRKIRNNTWLSPKTKKYALQKLDHINLIIGSPAILREDPLLEYNNKEAYQNLRRVALWRAKKMIELDGKSSDVDIPVIDWTIFKLVGKQSYVVNAYYTPTENSIYIPLGYLQKPFIDLDERGIEYNLAHIGFTLGHEMSHCLDDLGSQYDYKGNLFNWWTKEDRAIFNKKVKDVVKQYETFAAYDGIKMDASLSTGENLADISGLAICEEYLRDFQDKNNDEVPIRALSFHAFFTYVAIQARQKIFDSAVKAQLKTNPHPLDKYRTNCPLARLELFRSLYNIKKGDKMYWENIDTIW
jgi:putative endopeptidase